MRTTKKILLFVFACALIFACDSMPEAKFEGTYSAVLPSEASHGRKITLELNADRTAKMETDHLSGASPVVEKGTWTLAKDGSLIVELMLEKEGTIREAITFTKNGDMLYSTAHDQNLYGAEGLKLKKIK